MAASSLPCAAPVNGAPGMMRGTPALRQSKLAALIPWPQSRLARSAQRRLSGAPGMGPLTPKLRKGEPAVLRSRPQARLACRAQRRRNGAQHVALGAQIALRQTGSAHPMTVSPASLPCAAPLKRRARYVAVDAHIALRRVGSVQVIAAIPTNLSCVAPHKRRSACGPGCPNCVKTNRYHSSNGRKPG